MPVIADPLAAQIQVHQLTDLEIRKVMRDASLEADRIIRSLEGQTGVGARVRSAQIALAKANVQTWAGVKDAVKVGIGDAFDATSDLQAIFDQKMFKAAGVSSVAWRNSMLAQGRAGIDAFIARKEFNYTLSQRVYRNRALTQGTVNRTINTGLLLGKSAKEIANDVKKYIDPLTPGGASYAAMRLGRTEVQNAFHTSAVKRAQDSPWVNVVQWNLSGSHTRPDECNQYAEDSHFRGGEAGEFRVDDVPAKPHPNCLCYIEPVADDLDTFAKDFHSGKYDAHIDAQMGCSRYG